MYEMYVVHVLRPWQVLVTLESRKIDRILTRLERLQRMRKR